MEQRFQSQGEIWHVIKPDLLQTDDQGQNVMQREWQHGQILWQQGRFAVVAANQDELQGVTLPPQHRVVFAPHSIGGETLREKAFAHKPLDEWVVPRVAEYIERHGLYRGQKASREFRWTLPPQPRLLLVADEWNDRAVEAAAALGPSCEDDPDLIVVVGGDGTMLRAIRQHWRLRRPFFGLNRGHVGFLLNEHPPTECKNGRITLHQAPLLWVETEDLQGEKHTALAFNDAWVEQATGQTAWIEVRVDGQVRLERLISDGALVSTAAGSTSYARAMGGTPLPLATPGMLLVGSNVLHPDRWRPVVLPLECELKLTTLDPIKRPLRGYVDGVSHNEIRSMLIRCSRIAAVELAFDPQLDLTEKLAQIQFPK